MFGFHEVKFVDEPVLVRDDDSCFYDETHEVPVAHNHNSQVRSALSNSGKAYACVDKSKNDLTERQPPRGYSPFFKLSERGDFIRPEYLPERKHD